MAKSYYDILGVSRDAREREIRSAYRKLAREHHPDVNRGDSGAEARFKEINEAYQVLSDAENRKKYDRHGANWRQAGDFERAGNAGPSPFSWFNRARRGGASSSRSESYGSFGDVLSDLLGGRGGGGVSVEDLPRTQRVEAPVTVTLEEAYGGAKRMIEAPADPFSGAPSRRLEVTIPAGVSSGSRVHVGAPDGAGGSLDLYLKITIARHRTFERKGDDLLVTVEVPLVDAVLGGEAEVPTITVKKVALKVPPETPNGKVFRLKGKGMPRKHGGSGSHGDLLVTVKAELPSNLDDEQRRLFERLRELDGAGS
jgi:DnaJ-class molecular chaperone